MQRVTTVFLPVLLVLITVFFRVPMDAGIVGHVACTGAAVRIDDARPKAVVMASNGVEKGAPPEPDEAEQPEELEQRGLAALHVGEGQRQRGAGRDADEQGGILIFPAQKRCRAGLFQSGIGQGAQLVRQFAMPFGCVKML